MNCIAIYGAGEIGATTARRLAERELCRRIVLVDPDEGRAKGKALDLMQSGPTEGYDTAVEGTSVLEAAGDCDAVVLADGPVFAGVTAALPSDLTALAAACSRVTAGPVLAAVPSAAAFLEAAVRGGLPRDRVIGVAGAAFAGAVRVAVAARLDARPVDIALCVFGEVPAAAVVLLDSATCAGVPLTALSPTAMRGALETARRHAAGPVALAAATARILASLRGSGAVESVTMVLDGEYGHRGVALTVPARLAHGRIEQVVEIPLSPVDRVALDRAATRR